MPKTPPLTIRLNPETKAALDRIAEAEGRSLSSMIDRALVEWLKRRGPPKEKSK